MAKKRRTIRRIEPAPPDFFDDQQWPVVVAGCVLAAIAMGAVVTMFRGPLMWLSLLVLPALAAAALFTLTRMENRALRRTLQFSLIVSLAAHLLVLIVASVIGIFSFQKQIQPQAVARRQVKTIRISNNQQSPIPADRPSAEPEPEVEIEKRKSAVTSVPQTLPVPQSQPQAVPQTRRRKQKNRSVPRFSESLATLRRSVSQRRPNPSAEPPQLTRESKPTDNRQSPTSPSIEISESNRAADTLKRSSTATKESPRVTAIPGRVGEQAKQVTSELLTRRKASAQGDREIKPMAKFELANELAKPRAPSVATARIRRREAISRKVASAASRPPNSVQPSASANEVQRKQGASKKQLARSRALPAEALNPISSQPSPKKIRRRDTPSAPSITSPLADKPSSRLASADAPTPRSSKPKTQPVPNPRSSSDATEVQPQQLSVTKSTRGVSGVGASDNMQSGTGGLPSPAVRPSDAALNRRPSSIESRKTMLTDSQISTSRRTVAQARAPKSAFRAETKSMAKIAGAKTPSDDSLESSAAEIESSSKKRLSSTAAERGAAQVDIGSVKVVPEPQRRKLSGGGTPEVAALNPAPSRRSSAESAPMPSIAKAETGSAAAPRETAAKPSAAELDGPSQLATVKRQADSRSRSASEFVEIPETSELLQQISASGVASQAKRRNSESQTNQPSLEQMMAAALGKDGDRDDEEEKRRRRLLGNRNTRVAKAPTFRREDPLSGSEKGVAREVASQDLESTQSDLVVKNSGGGTLSVTEIVRQSATRLAVEAVRSLPMVSPSLARRETEQARDAGVESKSKVVEFGSLQSSDFARRPSVSLQAPMAVSAKDTGAAPNAPADASLEELSNVELSARTQPGIDAGIELNVDAAAGAAGLANEEDVDFGITMRPASEESEQPQPDFDNRYRRTDFGGAPSISPSILVEKEAFRKRTPAMGNAFNEPKTEAAIQLGLEFLTRFQEPDGSWSLTRFDTEHRLHRQQLDSDMAATGLAVLAFQGAGYNHREFKYARQVNHAIRWLIKNQREDGLLYLESDSKSNEACRLYSHGIATLALTEAWGMTQDPLLKEPAQKALDFIADSQDPEKGGWRYFVVKKSSDTSVSGWMMMAMQSGRLAGLDVKDESFDGITSWLNVAADPVNESLYRYNPYAVNSEGVSRIQGRNATPAMTSVGLLMRIYGGWEKDDPRLIGGTNFLVQQQMPGETKKLRDTYYWYYATQVLKHVDGANWQTWNKALRPMLIRTQDKQGDYAGSWHPYEPVPDRWGPFGGRLYVTTMNLLSLEVRHRLLPIYKTQDNEQDPDVIVIGESGE